MKQLISTFILLFAVVLMAQGQAEKNIVKSYPHEGASTITLAANGVIEVEEWDEDIVRLVTHIHAVNFNEATLKALAQAGRYTATAKNVDNTLILTMLKAQREIVIRGIKVEERYRFKVYVPRGITVEQVTHQEVASHF